MDDFSDIGLENDHEEYNYDTILGMSKYFEVPYYVVHRAVKTSNAEAVEDIKGIKQYWAADVVDEIEAYKKRKKSRKPRLTIKDLLQRIEKLEDNQKKLQQALIILSEKVQK